MAWVLGVPLRIRTRETGADTFLHVHMYAHVQSHIGHCIVSSCCIQTFLHYPPVVLICIHVHHYMYIGIHICLYMCMCLVCILIRVFIVVHTLISNSCVSSNSISIPIYIYFCTTSTRKA